MQLLKNGWKKSGDNYVHETAVIYPHVKLGKGNYIGPYCVIGGNGDIRGVKQYDFEGGVIIGDDNIISDLVVIHRPVAKDSFTIIGNRNIIMAQCYIAHDVEIQDDCEVCAHSVIGGYAKIENGARIKLNCTIRNRITVGKNSTVGMGSAVVKDVLEGTTVYGSPAKEK